MNQSAIAGKPPRKEPLPPSAFWKDSILEPCLIGLTNRGQSRQRLAPGLTAKSEYKQTREQSRRGFYLAESPGRAISTNRPRYQTGYFADCTLCIICRRGRITKTPYCAANRRRLFSIKRHVMSSSFLTNLNFHFYRVRPIEPIGDISIHPLCGANAEIKRSCSVNICGLPLPHNVP